MSAPGEFIRSALDYEGDVWRAQEVRERLGAGLDSTGASVGAVRGTVRDALRTFRGLSHDDVTALSTELWNPPVFEPRLAAVVLLQSRAALLRGLDLTRLEGFARDSRVDELSDPLARDVIAPLLAGLAGAAQTRADAALDRWATEGGRLKSVATPARDDLHNQG
ncbi:DNA alkylation repair protein [Rathayibacter iranicus]|uniref:DNA alkylation repair protein n=1 Tax=Rathayibacter iranicus TaxID=59737 RepID=A0AAD1AFC7_9MICO|nr:DNA alkylation repair protein [Rathayibacter iranicus]AZZ57347.1 DNA alkylation repair protein [Rathayibacter iranicus]MWV31702.1 DNA alkylation repair protein [Rathayibacter iranicus NCPPB 2253 = VKM Ac-1602]PPI48387.1 DNA alkylation repair protein [Rathayibacter iranicus]PPI61125.1 DNA alkylation repair protein [Rathayibacter iranicus]PPI72778.1 DNA alkylation repair protein [Rathayibacter iranicus]